MRPTPLTSCCFPNTTKAFRTRLTEDIADALGDKPIAVRKFEVQAAFAMTFNKLQGATMDSLVVVMADLKGLMMGSHSAAKAGVAFTRVRHSHTLGLFPCEDHELDHLLKLRHPGWLRAWAGNYDKDGFWRTDRLPIDPEALNAYGNWKHANPNNPTRGVGVTDLKRVTAAVGLSPRTKAPCGKTKSGFAARPMKRNELVTQLTRHFPQFDEELLRLPPPRQSPGAKHQNPRPPSKRKTHTATARQPPPGVAKKKSAAPVTSTAHTADVQVAPAPQQLLLPPCLTCGSSSCQGKCVPSDCD